MLGEARAYYGIIVAAPVRAPDPRLVEVPIMLTVTDTATSELKRLVAQQDNPNLALRVFVSPGGCSGMSYGMAFDDEEQEGDLVLDHDGVHIRVDEMSVMYLDGSEIDFTN